MSLTLLNNVASAAAAAVAAVVAVTDNVATLAVAVADADADALAVAVAITIALAVAATADGEEVHCLTWAISRPTELTIAGRRVSGHQARDHRRTRSAHRGRRWWRPAMVELPHRHHFRCGDLVMVMVMCARRTYVFTHWPGAHGVRK